jgi:hypothetical protein
MIKQVVKILDINSYYILTLENWSTDSTSPIVSLEVAYSVVDGSYIGDKSNATWLESKKIVAQSIDGKRTASIGFCKEEQKWYGWSHRAIYGFGIGSKVKFGDCMYMPECPQGLLNKIIKFWHEPECEYVSETEIIDKQFDVKNPNNKNSGLGVSIMTRKTRKSDGQLIESTHWREYPDAWGRGEWEAETLDEAKQMAIDFAKGVS